MSRFDTPEFQEYLAQRLSALFPVFSKASIGDFSEDIQLPPGDDVFAELFAGVQIMLDVIREKIADLEHTNAELGRQVKDLERLNRLMVGRELKMRELKQEVAKLQRVIDQLKPKGA